MNVNTEFLREFDQAAREAQRLELIYRDQAAAGIAAHERERQYAFRRLNLSRAIADAVAEQEDREKALATAMQVLSREIGWADDAPARQAIGDGFAGLAEAIWHAARGQDVDVAAAFAAFESWYAGVMGNPFLALLDQEMPERPVVEF